MSKNTTARKTVRRTVLIAGLVAAVALPLGLTASAQATPVKAATAAAARATVTGTASDNVTQVADFYGAYIDAKSDPETGGRLATELRKFYVTAGGLGEVAKWEAANQADGVLHAQNVPAQWTVKATGTAGRVAVTLTWGQSDPTRLVVDLDRNHKITHIAGK
ncbi:hypothetical protein [Streptomyces sp. NPDC002265]|uniref:hypothetical protein n=1 Tax=Streptomyces sp. NPDC002265 TaxID=3154415 RepID=UPI0033275EB1